VLREINTRSRSTSRCTTTSGATAAGIPTGSGETYIRPETLDLARGLGFGGGDRIVSHEMAAKWRVDPLQFMAIAA
jgi:hypothetical protein